MPAPTRTRTSRWSLARQLLVLQLAVLLVLVGGGITIAYLDAGHTTTDRARDQSLAVAHAIADSPSVTRAVSTPDPTAVLQPYAVRVQTDAEVDFVTIMTPQGIRYTHPNPALIGQPFLGHIAAAQQGGVVTETYTGSLGPSVRAVVPVFDANHRVVALVAVGITIAAISAELRDRVWPLAGVAAAVLLVGACGGWLVSARLKRQTRGIAPGELSNLFEYHEAVLHSVREGVLLVGRDGRVGLCNDGARTLLGLTADPVGQPLVELGLPPELVAAFVSAETRTEELHLTDTRVLVVSTTVVRSGGRAQGTVVILRDHTELQTLTGELTTARSLAEALRSQAHEAANRLHTVVSLVELGRPEDAVEFATAELVLAQELTDRVMSAVSEPVLAALLLGKAAEASERGVEFTITPDTVIEDLGPEIVGRDLVTILGNLVDNGIDAAARGASGRPAVVVTARTDEDGLLLRVADNGPGVPEEAVEDMFRRGWSTKAGEGHGLGLALVVQAVRRYGGGVDVGRDGGAVFTVRLPRQEALR
ncbi:MULTISPECIES: sensor histidine kinase [unclassified Amycolatopsis]|uniref:sensor histidine kinase n=1 Tax=unclassified Amycolatopsis TaxID=2618356 RepID=UPI001C6A5BDA|nr:sensor histidine kinase [Amycolatopsis sp. DSM 110486]QYN20739.1 sensor histidine kinase [Amycolatopsis sp. DSM 110486]